VSKSNSNISWVYYDYWEASLKKLKVNSVGAGSLWFVPLDECYDSFVDEPQLNQYLVSPW
jgi:hypothetical protein